MTEIPCDADGPPCRCVATDLLDALGRAYAMDLLCVVAAHEPVRFGTVEDHLPAASTSTLSARLDELEAEGLITREQYDEIPPRVEYALTDDGRELGERLAPVVEWIVERGSGDSNAERPDEGGSPVDRGPVDRGPVDRDRGDGAPGRNGDGISRGGRR